MRELSIAVGKITPGIVYEAPVKRLHIEGQSFPENARAFYLPVLDWLSEALGEPQAELTITVHLLYLNTSSISVFAKILRMLEEAQKRGASINIEWTYDPENELAREIGEEFQEIAGVPFSLREVH
jgi:hypothetical protein